MSGLGEFRSLCTEEPDEALSFVWSQGLAMEQDLIFGSEGLGFGRALGFGDGEAEAAECG